MTDQAEALKTKMELTSIPGTSLRVSRVAIGTWAIGGWMWGGTDEAESIATIRAAFEHGINMIRESADALYAATSGFSLRFVEDSAFLNGSRLRFEGRDDTGEAGERGPPRRSAHGRRGTPGRRKPDRSRATPG